jgi:hypothetical protein
MSLSNIIQKTNIDSSWIPFQVGENRGCYLIAIKGEKTTNDAMDLDSLKQIVVEIGIDSGIDKSPMPIQRCVFKFNTNKTGDVINDSASLSQTNMLPKTNTHIRVTSFSDGVKEVLAGNMPVSINILPV